MYIFQVSGFNVQLLQVIENSSGYAQCLLPFRIMDYPNQQTEERKNKMENSNSNNKNHHTCQMSYAASENIIMTQSNITTALINNSNPSTVEFQSTQESSSIINDDHRHAKSIFKQHLTDETILPMELIDM